MKYTFRFLILMLCILTSVSAFADRRGSDLFKPASNTSSPSQWNNTRSGNNFSYSRTSNQGYSSSSIYETNNNVYGTTANHTTTLGGSGTTLYGTANDDFLSNEEGGVNGPQRVRRKATANPGPLSDALPCLGALLIAFTLFKSRRKIHTLLLHRN